jgi:hypothetical protein
VCSILAKRVPTCYFIFVEPAEASDLRQQHEKRSEKDGRKEPRIDGDSHQIGWSAGRIGWSSSSHHLCQRKTSCLPHKLDRASFSIREVFVFVSECDQDKDIVSFVARSPLDVGSMHKHK